MSTGAWLKMHFLKRQSTAEESNFQTCFGKNEKNKEVVRMKARNKEKAVKQKFSMQLMWKQRYLLLMSVPFVVWLFVFKYVMGMDHGVSGGEAQDVCPAHVGASVCGTG